MLVQLQISEPRYLGCYFFNGPLGQRDSIVLCVSRPSLSAIRA
jgi:hypothetical protein